MNWWKVASRYGPSFIMTVILVTATLSDATEDATQPPEPTCRGGDENIDVCACDPECARYGDCCRTSPYFAPEEQRLGASPFTCMDLSGKSIYVIPRCPPDWGDSDTRNRCEHPDTNHRDPLLDAPVTSRSTNITYSNWYCAFCNSDLDANTTDIWDALFDCTPEDGSPDILIPDETFADKLSYNTSTSEWDLNIDNYDLGNHSGVSIQEEPMQGTVNRRNRVKQEYKHSCTLNFRPHYEEMRVIRICKTNIISHCLREWTGTREEQLCEAYTALVCSDYDTYRNYHCFVCNNFTVLNECQYSYVTAPPEFFGNSLSMLLDWKRLKRSGCASSEIYDPLSRICRKVFT
ncbi:uncharacterized protein LOC110828450 [Zootermopsis nevadensis]|uniref:uncharacterized protein LOC110828450 n=1 Tax=Zootermopsis nevadensis TaxID=136037 RepID=UPI000B8E8A1D|nr:uncharacterized protein LOC110828450 [Zootermopsis nevadensis]